MRVVVSGGTGLVGRRLVASLVADGHEVVVLTRDPASLHGELPHRVSVAAWDAEAGTLAPRTIAGADAVVHLAGTGVADKRWSPRRRRSILRSRVGGGEAITAAIAALPESDRPRVVVGGSAVGYYGDRGDELLREDAARGDGFLADVCDAWERSIVIDGVRTVSLRIGVVLARGGGALARMLPPFRLGAGGRLGSGRQWMSWIHVDDLVALIRHAIEEPALSGAVNATAPEPVTNAEFTKVLGRVLGRPAIIRVPAVALRVALGELAGMLLGGQRVDPAAARGSGFTWRYPDLESALRDTAGDSTRELYREQWVPRPIDQVFEFFSDAYNLEQITPDFMNFSVLGLEPEALGVGTTIRYKLRLRGLPMRWKSVIESWDPPHGFVDRQLTGPYSLWHHTHEFVARDGGTLMIDRVCYRLPLGAVGELVAGAMVDGDVTRIFDYRFEVIQKLFGASRPT